MYLKVNSPLVSVDWLFENLDDESLIILDTTIPKVGSKTVALEDEKQQIKNAIFFDLNVFSESDAPFPNTILSADEFQKKAQKIGVHQESCLVVYDDLGMYSSPRAWWMFQLMGFTNIAVLDGGFPAWKAQQLPTEKPINKIVSEGNFKANYQPQKIVFTNDVLKNLETQHSLVFDARSEGRFYGTEPEPRKEVRGGHIPNSFSLPHTAMLSEGKMKSKEDLQYLFQSKNNENKPLIFTCGSGITASVLALGAEIAGVKNHAVYDGSWTEWGSTESLPITLKDE